MLTIGDKKPTSIALITLPTLAVRPAPCSLRVVESSDDYLVYTRPMAQNWRRFTSQYHQLIRDSQSSSSHQDGSLQMALYARNYSSTPDPLALLQSDLSPKGSDWGVMNYQNPTLAQALMTSPPPPMTPNEMNSKKQAARILADERPLIPVVYYQQSASAHKSLQGLTLDPFERKYNLNQPKW